MGCLQDPANFQQTFSSIVTYGSKRPAIHVYFEYICWKFAERLLDRVNNTLLYCTERASKREVVRSMMTDNDTLEEDVQRDFNKLARHPKGNFAVYYVRHKLFNKNFVGLPTGRQPGLSCGRRN